MISCRAARSARARRAVAASGSSPGARQPGARPSRVLLSEPVSSRSRARSLSPAPGPVRHAAQQRGGELADHGGVDMTGDDRHERRVAVIPRPRGRARPRRRQVRRAGLAAQLVEGHVQLDLGGLPAALRQAPRPDQPPARFFQRVMLPLPLTAQILRTQPAYPAPPRRPATPPWPAGSGPRAASPRRPWSHPATGSGPGTRHHHHHDRAVRCAWLSPPPGPADLSGPHHPPPRRAGWRRRRAGGLGQQVGPFPDLPRPRLRDLPSRQRLSDRGVGGQALHPLDRRSPPHPHPPGSATPATSADCGARRPHTQPAH